MLRAALIYIVLSLLLMSFVFGVAANALTLVENGKSDFVIVIPEAAIPSEEFAATEMASHIRQMSGADLGIIRDSSPLPAHAIILGNCRYLAEIGAAPSWPDLGQEGYIIRTVGDKLVIAGGRPRGTLYGVYGLLEDYLACRWFTPDTSVVPKTETITLAAINTSALPAFEYREPWMYSGYIWSDWWREHFSQDYASRTRNSGNQLRQHVVPIDEKHGGSYKVVKFAHNLMELVPAAKYANDHPEYFAMIDGKRDTRGNNDGDLELCLTNPGVAQAAAETMAGWMKANPDADAFFIGQSDTTGYCRCENCNAARKKYGGWDGARRVAPQGLPEGWWNPMGGLAGLNIEFVSRVASILEKDYPNTKIGTFAYSYTRRPPRNIKAHKNVMVWYCPIERCFCHSIDRGPINDVFYNHGSEITSWKAVADKVFVYDYWLSGSLGQPTDLLSLRDNVKAYQRLGAQGVLVDSMIDIQAGFGFLRYWLWMELLRNPDFDADKGMDEFLASYYGRADKHIKQYIELVSKPESWQPMPSKRTSAWTADEYKPITEDQLLSCKLGYGRDLTTSAINKGYALFESAKRAVRDNPTALEHVLSARIPLQHAMLEQLPARDRRLKTEAVEFLKLWKKLECKALSSTPVEEYRAKLSKKLGVDLAE